MLRDKVGGIMRFAEFLESVMDTEDEELANYYMLVSIIEMASKGYPPEQVFEMDVEHLLKLLTLPPAPEGWNTTWGKHVAHH